MSVRAPSVWLRPLASSGLLLLGYLALGWALPNAIAFVPLLSWLDAERNESGRRRLAGILVFALAFYLVLLHWMYAMLEISPLAVLLWAAVAVYLAAGATLSIAVAAWLRRRTGWSYAILLPACWLPVEWARNFTDLRLTADHLAHSLAAFPFVVQFADLAGPYAVGWAMIASSGLIHDVVRAPYRERRRALARFALFLALLVGYDAWAWLRPIEAERTLRVGLVQPNVPLEMKWDESTEEAQLEVLSRLTREAVAEGAEVVVWPESARPRTLYHWAGRPFTWAMPEVQDLAEELGVTILTGVDYYRIPEDGPELLYNAAMVVHPDGTLDATWTAKVYLVPFVEKIPFERVFGRWLADGTGEWHWLSGGFAPPPEPIPLPAAGTRIGVLVCYEQLYFDLARRVGSTADFQVVLTNDAWFGRTVFQPYLADALRLRAIEGRSSFVRVANTGISGFVDPKGRYDGRTGLFEEGVEVRDVAVVRRRTVYDRIGDVPVPAAAIALAAAVVAASRRRQRPTRDEEPPCAGTSTS